ncbi:MAG: hypothetical protein WCK83_10060 [Burkholderiales bacterium]
MTVTLLRITTDYVDFQDRIRLRCEVEEGSSLDIWLTQRLLARLVPALCNTLLTPARDDAYAEVMQAFAQQSAVSSLVPQAPVQSVQSGPSWLAHVIDLNVEPEGTRIKFRGEGSHAATVIMEGMHLRQWLAILHNVASAAQWQLDVWPTWLHESAIPPANTGAVLH